MARGNARSGNRPGADVTAADPWRSAVQWHKRAAIYDYIFVPVIGADGEVEAVAGTTRDVTKRKETERQLREGEQQFDFALAAADLGHWSLNLADHTARRTLRHDQIFGYEALLPEWTYETFLQHVVPDDRAKVDADFQNAVATGSAWAVECRIRRADGAVRHIWTKALIRRDGEGRVESMLGIVGDVTDRKQAEEGQAFLTRLADTLRPLSDPIAVQAEASRVLGEWLGANRVAYFEVQGEDYVVERDYTDAAPSIIGRYPMASFGTALLDTYLAGRTATEADVNALATRTAEEKLAFAGLGIRSFIGVPLVKDGVLLAGLTVHGSTIRTWTPAEVAIAEDTAERTWAAVNRVRTESALRASEQSRWLALDAAELGTFNIDPTTNALTTDERFRIIFAGTTEAMDYEQAFAAIHFDDRERIREAVAATMRIDDPAPYAQEYRVVHRDGSVRWVFAKGRANFAGQGSHRRLVSFDGTIADITSRKEAEVRVQESEQRFRLVADAAPVLIWLSGTDKLCKWFKQPWLAFTGRTMAQEIGDGWTKGVHPDDVDRCLETYRAAFDAHTSFSMEYRLRRHDGEFRWLIDNGVPRFQPGGEFDGYIGSCLDVTDYKNAEAGLRDADRRKDEFLATLSHELRNPLAPIRNGLRVIRLAGATGTIEQARIMMERQLGQMIRLVDDLLDVSRVTTRKLILQTEQVELQKVIDAALETTRAVIEQAGHELIVDVPDDPVFVEGDATRLAQVVSNLLNNAAKYTPRGGHIQLRADTEGRMAILRVEDDGIGIPSNMLDKVFEMFTQVDRTLEKSAGGLGIGLSLVKGIVEMHGGSIEVRSKEGRGSEFIVRMPSVFPAVHSVERPPQVELPDAQRGRRILVADDNVDAAESLRQLLELLGNTVSTANDGLEALKVAETFRPEMILLDIGMPKLNGYEACRRIREQTWGNSAVVVAMTGWGQDDDKRRSRESGFDHHLVKPVDPKALEELLASLQP